MSGYDSREMARRGRIGALVTLSRHDPSRLTAPARARFRERFVENAKSEAQARGEDITEAEAARRGEAARRAFYAKLTHASVRARSRKKMTAPVGETSGTVDAEVDRARDLSAA